MKKRVILVFLGAIFTLLVIVFYSYIMPILASQRSILEGSTEFTLYSLKPESESWDWDNKNTPIQDLFHRNKVLGKIQITDPKVKTELVTALYQGIENASVVASCFNPHHGIRAVKGRRTVDVVICFGCHHVVFWENDKAQGDAISKSPSEVFNRVLKNGKVPLDQYN